MWSTKLYDWVEAHMLQPITNIKELAQKAGLEVFNHGDVLPLDLGKVSLSDDEVIVVMWGEKPAKKYFWSKEPWREFSAYVLSPDSKIVWSRSIDLKKSMVIFAPREIVNAKYISHEGHEYKLGSMIREQIAQVGIRLPEKVVELPVPSWIQANSYDQSGWNESTICFESEISGYFAELVNQMNKLGGEKYTLLGSEEFKEIIAFALSFGVPPPKSLQPRGRLYRRFVKPLYRKDKK